MQTETYYTGKEVQIMYKYHILEHWIHNHAYEYDSHLSNVKILDGKISVKICHNYNKKLKSSSELHDFISLHVIIRKIDKYVDDS